MKCFILYLTLVLKLHSVASFHTNFRRSETTRSLFAKRKGNKWSKRNEQLGGGDDEPSKRGGFGKEKNSNKSGNKKNEQDVSSQTDGSSSTAARTVLTAREVARLNTYQTKIQQEEKQRISYMQQCLEQRLSPNKRKKQIIQVSEDPLLFTIDDFIDPELCKKVDNQANGCFHLYFPEMVADQLFQGQESEMDGLLFNSVSSTKHASSDHPHYPDGLHVDTNNQCLFRHVTCLLYLNDVPEECGGATVFPIARALPNDPALKAARRLLEESISHTRSREVQAFDLTHDATLLEARIGTNFCKQPETDTAIRIQPKAGRLLIFFSRDEYGREDPRTWHAGERLRPSEDGSVTEKRILTLFKQVDYTSPEQAESTLESFLAPQVAEQRQWLQAKAALQKAIMERLQQEEK